ncbi:predicted protein [Streptomyces iranensis]|uniref:Uncharacterized protein n=1 Tax=Streptomyces iranensis TaxID=576784 RepID=A0A060ZAM8_9ACTN|nr:predicted protein [Streptomyces iranensis]
MRKVSDDTTSRNSASIGSINGEWNAWLTRKRRDFSNRAAISLEHT